MSSSGAFLGLSQLTFHHVATPKVRNAKISERKRKKKSRTLNRSSVRFCVDDSDADGDDDDDDDDDYELS